MLFLNVPPELGFNEMGARTTTMAQWPPVSQPVNLLALLPCVWCADVEFFKPVCSVKHEEMGAWPRLARVLLSVCTKDKEVEKVS